MTRGAGAFRGLWAILLVLLVPAQARALSTADLFRRYSPSVATLVVTKKDGRTGVGTGFLVSAGGEILTNFHVVQDAESVAVYFSEDAGYSARRVTAQDPERDLALVWVERIDPPLPYLGIGQTRPREGDDIVVIGSPKGFDKTVTTGIVSAYRTFGTTSLIQITAPISGGSSGSPVFDTNGRVVGIAIGAIRDAQGLNFAVDAKEIAAFLQTRPFKSPAASTPQQPAASLSGTPTGQPLTWVEVMAKLELARPGMTAAQVVQNLGEPTRTDEQNTDYYVGTWDYLKSNGAQFFVQERNGTVERSAWVEYFPTKEDAAMRAQTVSDLAAMQFGKPGVSSRAGQFWKRDGYTVGIEQHTEKSNHMVIFKLTK